MIIANGTIQPVHTEGGGFNEKGNPLPVQETLGTEVPCNITTDIHNQKGTTEDGTYSNQAYTILIDSQDWTANKVIIRDSQNKILGQFIVQDEQHLDCVNAIRLKVSKP